MHVLLLSLVFPPDNVSTAHLMGEVARDLAAAGHVVTVVTTTPHYNRDAVADQEQPLRLAWGGLLRRSRYHGLEVTHIPMPAKSASRILRVASWLWFHALSVVVGTLAVRKVDVILTPSPPLTMGLASWLLGRLRRAPFVYSVLELHPDIIVSLGLVTQPTVIRILYAIERFVYARAAHLTVIAPAMQRRMHEKGVPAAKVSLVPNFVDTSSVLATPRPNSFSTAHGLDDAFVVSYAGNIGPAQGLEPLLDAAGQLRDQPGIRIVIAGGGLLWNDLAARIRAERLDNVVLLPHQSFDTVSHIYGASDLSVVAQSATTTSDAVPSKVYRIMGASLPVLAITVPESDLAALIQDAECGAVVAPHGAAIAAVIREVAANPEAWRRRGAAGRAFVEAHYSRRAVTARYAALLEGVRQQS